MNLMALSFSSNNSFYKEILSRPGWKTFWFKTIDLDSVTSRLAQGDVDQVFILEDPYQPRPEFVSGLRDRFPTLPIVVISSIATEDEPWLAGVRVYSHLSSSFELIHALESGYKQVPAIRHFHQRWLRAGEDLTFDPHFFKSIHLSDVLDQILAFFSKKILCEDVYWVSACSLEKHMMGDLEALALELEADFKKSHRLRALNEKSSLEALKWLRELSIQNIDCKKITVIHHDFYQNLWVPLEDRGRALGYILLRGFEHNEVNFLLEKLEDALSIISRFLSFSLQMWETQHLTLIDDLTDLHNQRYLPLALDREISRAQRLNKKFTVLFMDIDYFKRVNDTKGHWTGSHLLVEIAKLFKGCLRSCDYAFRYGGDEFIALLVDSDTEKSRVVAERVRKSIEETSFAMNGEALKVTVSIGLASFPDHAQTRQGIIELADKAMYQGKDKSRNIVYVAS